MANEKNAAATPVENAAKVTKFVAKLVKRAISPKQGNLILHFETAEGNEAKVTMNKEVIGMRNLIGLGLPAVDSTHNLEWSVNENGDVSKEWATLAI